MDEPLLTLLGLALRAGRLAVGEDPVYAALSGGGAKVLFLARDAAGNTRDRLLRRRGETPVVELEADKARLGLALGRGSCALCAVTDGGFARRLLELAGEQRLHTTDGGVTI